MSKKQKRNVLLKTIIDFWHVMIFLFIIVGLATLFAIIGKAIFGVSLMMIATVLVGLIFTMIFITNCLED